MSRTRHIVQQCVVAALILLLVCAVGGLLIVRSGWFREQVRQRILAEVDKATGGRAEIGNFSFKWETLTATVAPFILHGTEAASEPPLLRVESVTLGLRIISMLERKVDLASMRVDRPRLRIVIYPDGSDNLPTPSGPPGDKTWAQNLMDVVVRRYTVTGGLAEVDVRQVPLDFNGENLQIQMSRAIDGLRYRGRLSSDHLRISSAVTSPAEVGLSAQFTLDGERLNLTPVTLTAGKSKADLNGYLTNLQKPRGIFKTKATVALNDVGPVFSLPASLAGTVAFDGDLAFSFDHGFAYELAGRANGRGLGFSGDRVKISDADLSARLRAAPGQVRLRDITAHALGAEATGNADLNNRDLHFDGKVSGLAVRDAAAILTPRAIPWNGILEGTVTADMVLGEPRAKMHAAGTIAPTGGTTPIQGQFDVSYDQRAGTIAFGESRVNTPATSLALSGILGQTLDVRARTTDLNDILTALALAGDGARPNLPFALTRGRGEASAVGTVAGPLADPEFRGQVSLTSASIAGHGFDRFASDVQANRRNIALRRLSLARGATQITGDVSVSANRSDFETGPLTARLNVKDLSLAEAAREFGTQTDVQGLASASVRLSGTARDVAADIDLDATKVSAAGETADRLKTNLTYSARALAFKNGQADLGAAKLLFNGTYEHPENNYADGALRAQIATQGLTLSRVAAVRKLEPDLDGRLDAKAAIEGRMTRGSFDLSAVTGDATARSLTLAAEKLGDVTLSAVTTGKDLALRAKAQVRGTEIDGQGQWRLEGDLPGSATLQFPHVTVAALHDLVMLRGTAAEKAALPPLEGLMAGSARVAVALRHPLDFKADVKIDTLQFNARPDQVLRLDVQAQDVQIRNSQPIMVAVTSREARVGTALFTARGTNLEASGVVPFSRDGEADLAVKGAVNLGILQLLNADLLARGTANINASIRGSVRDPRVNGRLEFTGASLYMNDVPNGIDSASGSVLFDRNRATIEKLTAETGGGQIAVRGFLDFGGVLIYRLQAEAHGVRVRYPEDVSLTADAQLALTGTSDASTISGTVTLNRAAISPSVDLGRLLAQAAKPTPASNPNEYLRGMRFDVRIGNAPTFGLETSLTRNVQSEVDLRLRGTILNPALLGTIAVNSGEIQVFGNKYTVNRGDIRFLNPVKIEPTFDVDLETRTSGITVNVTLAGTAEHLNVNYSSDPPLQSREIIALLAVGRDPTALGSAAQFSSSTAGFSDAGGLLGEAVSQQLSNRLQRFFGASRVKIDPTLTGVDTLPAARLTIEQQVARDITLTYITNLNRTQEQIVRIEWEFNQHWSAIAVRNSNGLFGIDVQYRKRF